MKNHNKQGFTLAELLIVVAIIAVLVAIAIPVFTTQLEKARVAVDQSTVRSAKAAAVAQYLTDGAVDTQTYYYTGSGVIVDETKKDSIKGYGKSTNTEDTGAAGTPKDHYLRIEVNSDGTINAYWEGGNDSGDSTSISRSENNIIDSDKYKGNQKYPYSSFKDITKNNYFNISKLGTALKDENDKNYLYICINKENIPKLENSDTSMARYFDNHSDANNYFYRVDASTEVKTLNSLEVNDANYANKTLGLHDGKYYIYLSGEWMPII